MRASCVSYNKTEAHINTSTRIEELSRNRWEQNWRKRGDDVWKERAISFMVQGIPQMINWYFWCIWLPCTVSNISKQQTIGKFVVLIFFLLNGNQLLIQWNRCYFCDNDTGFSSFVTLFRNIIINQQNNWRFYFPSIESLKIRMMMIIIMIIVCFEFIYS